jgi:DNA topoisomerase-1
MIILRIKNKTTGDKPSYKFTYENAIQLKLSNAKDKIILEYIQSLPPIPPIWDVVEIFYEKSPKIMYQARDKNGKLQQVYSPKWRARADKEKFQSLIEFGEMLPKINAAITKNLNMSKLTKEKVIAVILSIITICGFRIGQMKYYHMHGSIGMSTLLKKNLSFKKNKSELHISFVGKKGVLNECVITDKKIINEIDNIR